MGKIELLDCTLRDGGHINKSVFGKDVIISIIQSLLESNIDIIEVGFLQDCEYNPDRAMYNNIHEASLFLPEKRGNVKYSLMAQEDLYDDSKLEVCTGIIDIIRISFHDYDIEEGLACAKRIINKGYKCFINPINLMGYSDKEIIKIIERVNEIGAYGFTIVDTFGSMLKEDLLRIYYLVHNNLDSKISIAIHLHENLSLSYSLAQSFLDVIAPTRNACIDGSLYGMGRIPGNLCIELIMDYMNRTRGTAYDIEPIYDAIDQYIIDWKNKIPWGYSTAYAMSAQYQVHRTYAEYLLKKGKLQTKQINQILSMIEKTKRTKFDENYIEELYITFQNRHVDDTVDIEKIKQLVYGQDVLIIAPGYSILNNKNKILQLIDQYKLLTISANFVWNEITTNLVFFSNFRRLHEFDNHYTTARKIITSNLLIEKKSYDYVIDYAKHAYYGGKVFDNSVVMLLKMLSKMNPNKVYLAGFDGFSENNNFALENMKFNDNYCYSYDNQVIKQIISLLSEEMKIEFITPSIYSN